MLKVRLHGCLAWSFALVAMFTTACQDATPQDKVLKEVQRRHGNYRVLMDEEIGKALFINLVGAEVDDAFITELCAFENIRELNMPARGITDKGFSHLKKLRHLRFLDASDNRITDDGISVLAEIPGLEYLYLRNTPLSSKGLAAIVKLKKLKILEIEIADANTGGEAGKMLRELTELRTLKVSGKSISDEFFLELTNRHLVDLEVWASKIDDKALANLSTKFPDLETLLINGCKGVGDASMREIKKMSALKRVELYSAPVTDDGLMLLAAMKSLKKLDLGSGSKVTRDGLKRFREKAPHVDVAPRKIPDK